MREVPLKPEVKDKPSGLISFKWKWENATAKPYRIIKVWLKDAAGNQSNDLSGEVKVEKAIAELEEEIRIPMELKSLFGTKTLHLSAIVYKPPSGEKFPLLVLNHGAPRDAGARQKAVTMDDQGRVFVKKGFVVVVPTRRGFGSSEGDYAEQIGRCSEADYEHAANEVVKDVRATVQFMMKKPYVDMEKKTMVEGQSAGGFASLAYASVYPDEVLGVINFAGGKGSMKPYEVCRPDRLLSVIGGFGKTSKKLPTLWIYTDKDDFFVPELAGQMFDRYKRKAAKERCCCCPQSMDTASFTGT